MSDLDSMLALAAQAGVDRKILRQASHLSEEAAEAHYRRLTAGNELVSRQRWRANTAIGGLAAIAFAMFGNNLDWTGGPLNSISLFLVSILFGLFVSAGTDILQLELSHSLFSDSLVKSAVPITGTSLCISAADLISKCPTARQWRDCVLTRRSQLRGYDVEIMEKLTDFYMLQEAEKVLQAKYHEACLEAHGLSAPATA